MFFKDLYLISNREWSEVSVRLPKLFCSLHSCLLCFQHFFLLSSDSFYTVEILNTWIKVMYSSINQEPRVLPTHFPDSLSYLNTLLLNHSNPFLMQSCFFSAKILLSWFWKTPRASFINCLRLLKPMQTAQCCKNRLADLLTWRREHCTY